MVIRTVKNGRVKINGNYYAPQEVHQEYDGRFEGKRYAFNVYKSTDEFVEMWGTEAMIEAETLADCKKAYDKYISEVCFINADNENDTSMWFSWEFWDKVNE